MPVSRGLYTLGTTETVLECSYYKVRGWKPLSTLEAYTRTLRDAWSEINQHIISHPGETIEDSSSNGAFIDGISLTIESATGEGLDLGEVGYTKAKWSHLLKGYFFPESYYKALAAAKEYMDKKQRPPVGIIFYGERLTKEKVGIASSAGPCLLSMSFSWRYGNPTPRVFIHSRSSELSRKFYADCCFIHTIIRSFATDLGFDYDEVKIEWRIDRALQGTDYMPAFLYNILGYDHPDKLTGDHKWIKQIRKLWPSEGEVSKLQSRQRAINEYFKLLAGETNTSLPAKELVLPYA